MDIAVEADDLPLDPAKAERVKVEANGCGAVWPANFITIETDANLQAWLSAQWWVNLHDLAGAAPFGGGLVYNFFGHVKANFEGLAFFQRSVRGEANPAFGNVE